MLGKLIFNEVFKQKRTALVLIIIAIPIFTSILLAVDFGIRYKSYLHPLALQKGMTSWQMLMHEQNIVFFKQYIPLFGAMIISSIFESEYRNNGWTLSLTYPVSRRSIVISKFIASLLFMIIILIINNLSLIGVGKLNGFLEAVDKIYFVKMFLVQVVSVMPVMIIHLYITIRNKNTLVSIGIAAFICVVSSNLYSSKSAISQYNPYSFVSLSDGLIPVNLTLMIIISIVLTVGGLIFTISYFNKKECY